MSWISFFLHPIENVRLSFQIFVPSLNKPTIEIVKIRSLWNLVPKNPTYFHISKIFSFKIKLTNKQDKRQCPSIRDWVLRKRGLDEDNSCLILEKENYIFFNFILCNFLVRTLQCFQNKKSKKNLPPKTSKNCPQKLLIIP